MTASPPALGGRHGVITRFFIQGGAQLGSAACGFATTLVMVRALGVSGFGAVALGLSVLSYGLIVASFGSDIFATQSTARDPSLLRRNLGAVCAIRAAASVPTLAVIMTLCALNFWEPHADLAVALFSISVIVNIGFPLWVAQALERTHAIAAATFGGQALNLIFVLIAAWLHGGIVGFAAAKIGSDLVVAACLSVWIHRTVSFSGPRATLGDIVEMVRRSAPLAVSQVMRTLALASDLVVLSFFVSAAGVGLYAVPFRLFLLTLSLTSVYVVVVLPAFVRSASEGGASLARALRRMMWLPMPLLLVGLVVVGLVAGPLLGLLFGQAFEGGKLSLRLLLAAAALNFVNRSYRSVILASGRMVGDMNSTLVATALNLAAKLILIPIMGIAGAAAGTLIGEAILALLQRRQAMQAIRSATPAAN